MKFISSAWAKVTSLGNLTKYRLLQDSRNLNEFLLATGTTGFGSGAAGAALTFFFAGLAFAGLAGACLLAKFDIWVDIRSSCLVV